MLQIAYSDLPTLSGRDLGRTDWVTVTQDRVDRFANATDDHQWIHVDRERAAQAMGGTIAHGYLTLSLLPMLGEQLMAVDGISHALNMGTNKVRFTAAIPVGSRIRLHQVVKEVRPRGDGLQIVLENVFERDGQAQPVCVAETVALYLP